MGNQEEAKIGGVSDEVDKPSNKGNVQGGIRAADKEFVVLIELLMIQMLKLDEIEAEGELKVQRKNEICRVQSFLDSLDKLRATNRNMNRSASLQDVPLLGSRSLCFSIAPKTSAIITQQWERFD